jgi:hypothetical protein
MKPVEALIEAAVVAVIQEELEVARESLREIDFGWLTSERSRAMERVWGASSTVIKPIRPSQKTPRAPVRTADALVTFQRDQFTCRYAHCQRRTIYLPVLKELSRLFPDALPYQRNWRPVQSHIVYWMWSTSLEHRVAFPFGGTSEPANLLTACYQCNDVKNYLPFETLGWRLTEPATSHWDGLRRYLPRLSHIGRGEYKVESPPTSAPTIVQNAVEPTALQVGNLIRAQLPGKRQARCYRIDSLSGSAITLSEMWRRNSDRTWVVSKNQQTFPVAEFQCLSVLRALAPAERSVDLSPSPNQGVQLTASSVRSAPASGSS